MPRLKQIVKTATFEKAKRLRRCARNKSHEIPGGTTCLTIKEGMQTKSYCTSCAREILEAGRQRIADLIDLCPS